MWHWQYMGQKILQQLFVCHQKTMILNSRWHRYHCLRVHLAIFALNFIVWKVPNFLSFSLLLLSSSLTLKPRFTPEYYFCRPGQSAALFGLHKFIHFCSVYFSLVMCLQLHLQYKNTVVMVTCKGTDLDWYQCTVI